MTNIGIVGAGNISGTHARAASKIPGLKVAAVFGEDLAKTAALARLYDAAAYHDFEAFLKHRPMDVVAIGSPSGLHAQQGTAAARRGFHVLVEKPVDISLERVDALIVECERAGVKLGVFFQDRVKPDIVRLKKFIDDGKLGKPILATAHVRWYRPPAYYEDSRWRGTWALDGGGALMNQGIHTVDLLIWLMGPVRKVYAKAITALHRIEVEDTVVASLEFESGAIGTLEAATSAFPGYRRRMELTGTEGTILLEHDRVIAADVRTQTSEFGMGDEEDRNASASSPIVSDVRGHRMVLEDFLRAIKENGVPRCDGCEGRKSVELVQAVYESSRTGEPVVLR